MPVDGQGLFEIVACQGTAAGNHGEPVGTGVLVRLGGFHDFLFVQEPVFFTAGVMAGGLGAVFAVFAAAAAAGVDDGTEIHVVAAEMGLQPAGFFLEFG